MPPAPMIRIFMSVPLGLIGLTLRAGRLECLEAEADFLDCVAAERLLRRDRRADVEAAELESGLDAGRQRVFLEELVDPPERLLELERLVPAAGHGEVVQADAGR